MHLNADLTATVAHVTAFGQAEEIDLEKDETFAHGSWSLGLHRQPDDFGGFFDALSIALSSAVIAGNTYDLHFQGKSRSGSPSGRIDVGLSNSANSFGTLIFSGMPPGSIALDWTQFDSTFIAPVGALYLTVQVAYPGGDGGVGKIDNFILENRGVAHIPEPSTAWLLPGGLAAAVVLRRRLR